MLRPFSPTLLWLGVLGLLVLLIPLYLMSSALGSEVTDLETQLASNPDLPDQGEILAVTLTAVHSQTEQMALALSSLAAENVDWNAVILAINNVSEDSIRLTGLEQVGDQLFIQGQARSSDDATVYADQLIASGQFSQVVVQSIEQLSEPFFTPTPAPPTPLPTTAPTNTPQPTAIPTMVPVTPKPTWTPTPRLADEFEWDDHAPQPIFLGFPAQTHNFYPDFDVDYVTFLAKAGRTYEVSTDFLSPGVDTFLTVTIGDTVLTNDDADPGFLSSSVTLQAPPDSDVEVLVQVSNRGVYGADKWYDLLVLEVVPTTPTPSATVPTATPSVTPSATVDLRDIHEPNDVDPNPIAIGETQFHNFFPNGDVDKVNFLVKNGRFYQILTSQLGIGVDTAMTVDFNGETWQNDDYDEPGSGNLAAAVCFPAEADGTAVATIEQVGQQYSPNQTYIVAVQEVASRTAVPDELDFGMVTEGAANPAPQTIQLESSEPLTWTVDTEASWILTEAITNTIPATITVTASTSGLAAGLHTGELIVRWSDSCPQTIPVTVQVDPVQSALPNGITVHSGRNLPVAKVALLQNESISFVIVVTLQVVEP